MEHNSRIVTERSAQANQDICQFVKIERTDMPTSFWRASKVSPHWHAVGFNTLQVCWVLSHLPPFSLSTLLMKGSVVHMHVLLPVVSLTWQQNTQWSLKNKTSSESQALQKQETTEKKHKNAFYPVKSIGFIYTNREPNIMSKALTKYKSEHRCIFISKLFWKMKQFCCTDIGSQYNKCWEFSYGNCNKQKTQRCWNLCCWFSNAQFLPGVKSSLSSPYQNCRRSLWAQTRKPEGGTQERPVPAQAGVTVCSHPAACPQQKKVPWGCLCG